MKHIVIPALFAIASVAAHAQHAPKFYAEAGYSFIDYEEHDAGDTYKSSPKAIRLVGGAELNKNVAVELMLGFNGGDDSVKYNGVTFSSVKLKIDSMYGVYVKPKYELAPNFDVFGRVGYAHVSATVSASGFGSDSGSDSDLSYGIGASYHFDRNLSVNVDYMSYLNKSDYSAKGFTVGVGYKF